MVSLGLPGDLVDPTALDYTVSKAGGNAVVPTIAEIESEDTLVVCEYCNKPLSLVVQVS